MSLSLSFSCPLTLNFSKFEYHLKKIRFDTWFDILEDSQNIKWKRILSILCTNWFVFYFVYNTHIADLHALHISLIIKVRQEKVHYCFFLQYFFFYSLFNVDLQYLHILILSNSNINPNLYTNTNRRILQWKVNYFFEKYVMPLDDIKLVNN